MYKVENGTRVTIEEWELEHEDELSVKVFNLSKKIILYLRIIIILLFSVPYVPYEFVVIIATIAGKLVKLHLSSSSLWLSKTVSINQ